MGCHCIGIRDIQQPCGKYSLITLDSLPFDLLFIKERGFGKCKHVNNAREPFWMSACLASVKKASSREHSIPQLGKIYGIYNMPFTWPICCIYTSIPFVFLPFHYQLWVHPKLVKLQPSQLTTVDNILTSFPSKQRQKMGAPRRARFHQAYQSIILIVLWLYVLTVQATSMY